MSKGICGYGRYNDDPEHVGCPRAKTSETPCIARDGSTALADDHKCVGCDRRPSALLKELRLAGAIQYPDPTGMGPAGRQAARRGSGGDVPRDSCDREWSRLRSAEQWWADVMTSDDVRNFIERDRALISKALDHGPDVILRAAEMITNSKAEKKAGQSGILPTDSDLT